MKILIIIAPIVFLNYLNAECSDLDSTQCVEWAQYCEWDEESGICTEIGGGGENSVFGPYEYSYLTESDGIRSSDLYNGTLLYYPLDANPPYSSIIIMDAFGDEYVDNLVKTNIKHLNYLNCFLANSYEIVKISADIDDKFPLASSFLKKLKHQKENNYVPDLDDFNVLMYNFPRDRKLKKSYRIDNTDYVIVFFSENEFVEIFNNYIKNI